MRADVRQVLASMGLQGFRYWDPGDRFPDEEGSRAEVAGAVSSAGIAVAFVSPSAGTGRTALASTFVTLLAHAGARCAAVDLDPRASLATRLGGASAGRRIEPSSGAIVAEEGRFGVRCLAVPGAERLDETTSRTDDPKAFLAAALGDPDWTVIDGEADPAVLRTALRVADEIILVLRPEDASGSGATEIERWLSCAGCGRAGWLLNRYDGRRADHRAARQALRLPRTRRLLPFVVDEEPAFSELEPGATLVETAPDSEVLRVLGELASRIASGLSARWRGGGRG